VKGGAYSGLGSEEICRSTKSKSLSPSLKTSRAFVDLVYCLALFAGLGRPPTFLGRPFSASPVPQAETKLLQRILDLAADYCRRLNNASLYYVCREDVEESHVAAVEVSSPHGTPTLESTSRNRHWVYDYQLARTSLGLSEVRTLIEEDGQKKNEPGARLETGDFDFKTVIFGPNGMFGAESRGSFNFALTGERMLDGEDVLLVKATPNRGGNVRVLYGTAWLRLRDGAALRIDWDRESMKNVSFLEVEAQNRGQVPDLGFRSDYGFEKNGLRFPSRYSISLEWSDPASPKLLFSPENKFRTATRLEVVYSDYKFFTVEVEVKDP
jgi:hypothetical protein